MSSMHPGTNSERVLPYSNRLPEEHEPSSDVVKLIQKVARLLESGTAEKALELLHRSKSGFSSPSVRNAIGVCHLRLGNYQSALNVYRALLLAGGIHTRSDAPVVWKLNFAVTLLLNHNVSGYNSMLAEMRGTIHPDVDRLETAVRAYRKSLTVWQKLQWLFGVAPSTPIDLGFPPGILE